MKKVVTEAPAQDLDLSDFEPEDLPDEDPLVLQLVDQAVAPYAKIVSPAYLRAMRAALADVLVMHPITGDLIRSLRERAPRQISGEEPVDGTADTTAKASNNGKKAGGTT